MPKSLVARIVLIGALLVVGALYLTVGLSPELGVILQIFR